MIGICAHCQQFSPALRRCDNKACGLMYCMSCASLTQFCPRCSSSGTLGHLLDNIKGVSDPSPQQTPPPESGNAAPPPTRRKGRSCPHCGGVLALDAASKQYRACQHCRPYHESEGGWRPTHREARCAPGGSHSAAQHRTGGGHPCLTQTNADSDSLSSLSDAEH